MGDRMEDNGWKRVKQRIMDLRTLVKELKEVRVRKWTEGGEMEAGTDPLFCMRALACGGAMLK